MHPDKYTLPSGSSWTRLYRRADDEPPGRCERACGLAAQITEKDEAVLAYLTDITYVDLSEEAAPAKAGAPAAAAKAGEEEEDEDEEEEEEEEGIGSFARRAAAKGLRTSDLRPRDVTDSHPLVRP